MTEKELLYEIDIKFGEILLEVPPHLQTKALFQLMIQMILEQRTVLENQKLTINRLTQRIDKCQH